MDTDVIPGCCFLYNICKHIHTVYKRLGETELTQLSCTTGVTITIHIQSLHGVCDRKSSRQYFLVYSSVVTHFAVHTFIPSILIRAAAVLPHRKHLLCALPNKISGLFFFEKETKTSTRGFTCFHLLNINFLSKLRPGLVWLCPIVPVFTGVAIRFMFFSLENH